MLLLLVVGNIIFNYFYQVLLATALGILNNKIGLHASINQSSLMESQASSLQHALKHLHQVRVVVGFQHLSLSWRSLQTEIILVLAECQCQSLRVALTSTFYFKLSCHLDIFESVFTQDVAAQGEVGQVANGKSILR